jgi:hypothetical protein
MDSVIQKDKTKTVKIANNSKKEDDFDKNKVESVIHSN